MTAEAHGAVSLTRFFGKVCYIICYTKSGRLHDQCFKNSFVLVSNVFTPENLKPIKKCIKGLVDGLSCLLLERLMINEKRL